jgi:hypothetical protein
LGFSCCAGVNPHPILSFLRRRRASLLVQGSWGLFRESGKKSCCKTRLPCLEELGERRRCLFLYAVAAFLSRACAIRRLVAAKPSFLLAAFLVSTERI